MVPARDARRRLVAFVGGCEECGLLFTSPQRSREELETYYADEGAWAERIHEQKRRGKARPPVPKPMRRVDRLLLALGPHVPVSVPPAGAKVLDCGCGDGKFLNALQKWGWDTYGVEPSMSEAFPRHHRLEAPPQDASFDFVILHQVLEHIREPLDLLRQLAGSMREGGSLFISVPRLDTVPEFGHFNYCLDRRHHLVAFSETCLTGLLARVGLAVTARIDDRELDEALTRGQPRRLRLLAVRTSKAPALPSAPLEAANRVLREYRRRRDGAVTGILDNLLPVRFRAALMIRSREREKRLKRAARAAV